MIIMKKNLRIATNPNTRSARDCSGNPASHHILLFLYLYYKYSQWCDADWSEKPVPLMGEAPKLFIKKFLYSTLCPPSSVFCPQGAQATELTNMYTPSGKLLTILMDSHDGSSRNHPVVTYTGPIQKDGKVYLQRKTGNNVEMDIEVDPLYRRPKSIQTKLSDGHIEQKISYQYDKKGNITKITNHFHEDRNQEFEYDAVNRITKAKGKYGEETYSYHKNGNLLKRGQFNLQYNNPNHIHAVTRADSPQTGLVNYQYDSVGNLIQRNGDIYRYNATGKLQEITTEGGDKFTYTYDHLGNRIKKHLQNANTTTYSFGDLYEIHRAPGEPEKHTMYITGMQGDKVSQYSRPDAMLVMNAEGLALNAEPAPFGSQSGAGFGFAGVLVNAFWNTPKSVYLEMERDLAMVCHGIPSISLFKDSGVPKPIAKIFFWLFCFTLLLYYAVKLKSENPRIIRITSAIATYAFFFASGYGCTPLFYGGAQTEEGIPPWLLGLGIPGNTPSVSDAPGNYGGGGTGAVGGGQATARIPGMFFYHPDHLGSITMITDGHGQVLAGGERGGKSHISYRPYGEIFRTDSYGPDISKYKYTGQEEDKESGLYYYKARYYDPVIGRFAQNDSMAFPDRIQGMNRMMYVEGNPMSFTDGSGHMLSNSWAAAAVAYFMVKDGDGTDAEKFIAVASAYAKGRAKDRRRSNNFLDRSLNTGNFFKGIERNSSIGRGLTHNWNNIRNSHVGLQITKRYRMARSKAESEAQAFIKDPGVYMRNSDPARAYRQAERDFKRSDFVRGLKSIHRQYDHFLRYPKYAIESSDLAKSDIGRELTALYKSPCGGVLITIAIYKFGGFISDFFLVMGVPENVLKAYGLGSGLNDVNSCFKDPAWGW